MSRLHFPFETMVEYQDSVQFMTLWRKRVQKTVSTILSKIIPENDSLRLKCLSAEAMVIWQRVFTHESADVGNNYESIEYIGDKVCSSCFSLLIATRYSVDMSVTDQTTLNNMYMQKGFQGNCSYFLNLNKVLRIYVNQPPMPLDPLVSPYPSHENRNIVKNDHSVTPFLATGDVFESFVGGLYLVGKELGFLLCYKLMNYLFKTIQFPIDDLVHVCSVTNMDQMFEIMRFDKPKFSFEPDGHSSFKGTLAIDPNVVKKLRTEGIVLKPKETSVSCSKPSKKMLKRALYDQLNELMKRKNMNVQKARYIRFIEEIGIIGDGKYVSYVRDYIAQNNLLGLYFKHSSKGRVMLSKKIKLFGLKATGGSEVLLDSRRYSNRTSTVQAKLAILQEILSKQTGEEQTFKKLPDATKDLPWLQLVQKKIYSLIKSHLSAERAREIVSTVNVHELFYKAFCDDSYSAKNNMNGLSHMGHSLLSTILGGWMLTCFKLTRPSEYTTMNMEILSKENTAKYADEMDLVRLIKYRFGSNESSLEDSIKGECFQAVIGAIFLASGAVGYLLCYKIVIGFISIFVRDKNPSAAVMAKTNIFQVYTSMNMGSPTVTEKYDPNVGNTINLELNDYDIGCLAKLTSVPIKKGVFATVRGLKYAKNQSLLYVEAYAKLNKIGIDVKKALNHRRRFELGPYHTRLTKLCHRKEWTNVYLSYNPKIAMLKKSAVTVVIEDSKGDKFTKFIHWYKQDAQGEEHNSYKKDALEQFLKKYNG